MRIILSFWVLSVFAFTESTCVAQDSDKVPLNVLFLARADDSDREQAFESFLKSRFEQASVIPRTDFEPADAVDYDVVVVDWSQSEDREDGYPSPLGDLEQWSTPTVLLGSAGLLIAGPWQTIGGAG